MAESETVESLDKYRPGSKKLGEYEVSLTFSGSAGKNIMTLWTGSTLQTPNEVVLRAFGLLLSAKGKEILLKDPMMVRSSPSKSEVPARHFHDSVYQRLSAS